MGSNLRSDDDPLPDDDGLAPALVVEGVHLQSQGLVGVKTRQVEPGLAPGHVTDQSTTVRHDNLNMEIFFIKLKENFQK